ncbi:MAG: sugar transferase [Candidatus Binataceae bacterium]
MRRRMLATKRGIDVVISLAALIVLSPVLLIIAVAIMIKMGWPPVFSQERPGLQGRLFRIYKFRTMTAARDAEGALLPDEQRLTPLGKFLRRTSLDELPELFNVLKGDMSLVGPRPLLPEYLAHYTTEQRRRHDLRPGMSGWSQVNGRNALTWEEKFVLDVWYVDHLSLWLDLKILARTAWIALAGHGVSAPGHATMPRFDEIMARREGAEDV